MGESSPGPDEASATGRFARVPRVGLANVIRLLEEAQRNGSAPTLIQVANAVGQTLNSGAFRMRTAAAALYGAVEPERGRLKITDRGHRLLDPDTRRIAAGEAFFAVEVFDSFYRTYEGVNLPAEPGMEAELKNHGVNPKLLADVRRVMISTAEMAGLFDINPRRLTRPAVDFARGSSPTSPVGAEEVSSIEIEDGSLGAPVPSPVHALISSLVTQLPSLDEDADPRRLQRWLNAVRGNLEMLYQVDLVDPFGSDLRAAQSDRQGRSS